MVLTALCHALRSLHPLGLPCSPRLDMGVPFSRVTLNGARKEAGFGGMQGVPPSVETRGGRLQPRSEPLVSPGNRTLWLTLALTKLS